MAVSQFLTSHRETGALGLRSFWMVLGLTTERRPVSSATDVTFATSRTGAPSTSTAWVYLSRFYAKR
jgi:hypothetical protein